MAKYSSKEEEIQAEQEQRAARRAARAEKRGWLYEPTWGAGTADRHPVTELLTSRAGGLSPFGEQQFPLDPAKLRYAHPTDKPNRGGAVPREERKTQRLRRR